LGRDYRQVFYKRLGNRFLPKFAFYPYWQIEKVRQNVAKEHSVDREEIDMLEPDACDGGELYVWSEGLLKKEKENSQQTYVYLGYSFHYSRKNQNLKKRLYAGVWVKGHNYEDFGPHFKSYPDEKAAQAGARKIIRQQLKKALKDYPKLRSLHELLRDMEK
jgi:hypothetical protein